MIPLYSSMNLHFLSLIASDLTSATNNVRVNELKKNWENFPKDFCHLENFEYFFL